MVSKQILSESNKPIWLGPTHLTSLSNLISNSLSLLLSRQTTSHSQILYSSMAEPNQAWRPQPLRTTTKVAGKLDGATTMVAAALSSLIFLYFLSIFSWLISLSHGRKSFSFWVYGWFCEMGFWVDFQNGFKVWCLCGYVLCDLYRRCCENGYLHTVEKKKGIAFVSRQQ